MAFNPFNVFRRNSRLLFSILTVFIMFMFIFSTGLGRGIDFFDWVPNWIGSKRATGDVMAVIDGDKVRASELERLRDQRDLANQFMAAAHERSANNLVDYISQGLARVTPQNREAIQQVVMTRPIYVDMRNPSPGFRNRSMMAQLGMGPQISADDVLAERDLSLARLNFTLGQIIESKKQDDVDLAQAARLLIDTDLRNSGRRNLYFTNQPNSSKKDLLEFVLWRKKAEDLGIAFNDEQVSELIKSEFYHKLTPDDSKAIEDTLRNKRGYTPDALKHALAEEFKVRAAQVALMGSTAARPAAQLTDSPYDYFKGYQELCSLGRYGLISVPVANYLPQVTGQPTDKELRDLFAANKGNEPDPRSSRPALKEPRKIKIEWIEVKGDEPFYKAAADEGLKKLDVMARVGGFLTLPLGGVASAGPLIAPAALTIPDPVMVSAYEEYKREHKSLVQDNWYSSPADRFPPFGETTVRLAQPLESSANRPAHVASLTALFAGSLATGGVAFAPPLAFGFEGRAADQRARLDTLPAALIVPALPGLGLPSALIPTMVAQANATEPLPLAQVRERLAAKMKIDMARNIANRDLVEFQKELTKLGNKSDKSEARTYVDKYVAERGITAKQTKDFHGMYTMHMDETLKPLVDLLPVAAGRFGRSNDYINPAAFGGQFFIGRDGRPSIVPYQAQSYPRQGVAGPTESQSEYLIWRIAEKEAEAPRTLDEPGVRDKVIAAWRLQKARELAKKAADDLAKQCENLGTSYFTVQQKLSDKTVQLAAQFPDPAAKARVKYFEIDDVAPLVTTNTLGVMAQASTDPFGLKPRAELPFPTVEMADELVKAKDKPISTAFVLVDQPEDAYYVAVLANRSERNADEFWGAAYSRIAQYGELGAKVSLRHQAELRKKTRDQAVALLKAEYKYEQEHEKVNEKIDSSSED